MPDTHPESKKRILFVCVENAGRSQMAEAFARFYAGDQVEVWSAGSRPGKQIHPQVVQVMQEKGIDLKGQMPKGLNTVPEIAWDYLITMGCGDECPLAREIHREEWELPNPKDQNIEIVRHVRDQIDSRVKDLLKKLHLPAIPTGH